MEYDLLYNPLYANAVTGITCEGIFRVNGNSRVVDRLRSSFDRHGDAELEEAGDVMAVAGLLKLYLRELPDGVIPDNMTQLFVTTQLGRLLSYQSMSGRVLLYYLTPYLMVGLL